MPPDPPPLPNLSTPLLEYLRAVSVAPTWAEAAAAVGVTPSALSQGLRELERRLGVPLFERAGRRRVLRPEAAEVVAYAERVLAQTRDLARWAAESRGGRAGRLRVGMIDAAAVHHHPAALRTFREGRPEVDLHLTVAPSGALLAQLAEGALDLVVCVAPVDPLPGVQLVPLLDEPLHVYAPGPAHADPARWGPWVAFPAGSHTRELVARALRTLGAPYEVVAESHQPEVLREMVRLGLGWAVLPRAQAEAGGAGPLRVGGPPVATRTLAAARRTDALPNPAADALVAALLASSRTAAPG